MKVCFKDIPAEFEAKAKELFEILGVEYGSDGVAVTAKQIDNGGLSVNLKDYTAIVSYSEKVHFFRALGLLIEQLKENKTEFEINETPSTELLGAMIDCSRNAVMNVESVKRLIRHLALMGHNMLMLYTEDTYEIPGYPYFGYMRGRYTASEIKKIDDYCFDFGIELVPCIQTLAHLGSIFRWPVFQSIHDVNDILLAEEPKTYELIEAMIKTCASNFRSRRINIGMDEAHMLGLGNYLDKHGYKKRFEIMRDHLKKVVEICEKYNFKPMMWSDMFFRTSSDNKTRNYFDTETPLPENIRDMTPKNVSLIYWDYYHKDVEFYDKMIELHQGFDNEVVFAGGAWNWIGFAPLNKNSYVNAKAALKSCASHAIKKIFVTVWGDGGAECPVFSVLPILQLYAESCYAGNMSEEYVAKRFKTCTEGNFEDFMNLDIQSLEMGVVNPSKYLLYQDILTGITDKHVVEGEYAKECEEYRELLIKGAARNPKWAYLFETLSALCDVLTIKSDIGIRLKRAYDNKAMNTLKSIAESDLPMITKKISKFEECLFKQWMTVNKVFGYDVQDIRLGGIKNRVKTAINRINSYLDGKIDSLAELEEERLDVKGRPENNENKYIWYPYSYTASVNVLE